MQFQEIHANFSILGILGVLFSFIAGAGVFILLSEKFINKTKIIFCLSMMVAVVGATSSIWIAINTSHANDDAFIANVMKKYDVDEVLLEYREITTINEFTTDQKIHVSVDGKIYAFDLDQNKETWEPILIDPPINGGSEKGYNLSADELLR